MKKSANLLATGQIEISELKAPDSDKIIQPRKKSTGCSESHNAQINLIDRLIQKEVHQCSKQMSIDKEELIAWISLQKDMHPSLPSKCILHLLRAATKHQLDPLQEEVLLTQYEDQWEVIISIDGWIKLINRHPAFTGISFHPSPEENEGIPIWIECTITRSDRTMPTTTREYLMEARNDSEYWKKMPRRMLRHKAMQQCARIALGITVTDGKIEKMSHEKQNFLPIKAKTSPEQKMHKTQSEKLKSLLVNSI